MRFRKIVRWLKKERLRRMGTPAPALHESRSSLEVTFIDNQDHAEATGEQGPAKQVRISESVKRKRRSKSASDVSHRSSISVQKEVDGMPTHSAHPKLSKDLTSGSLSSIQLIGRTPTTTSIASDRTPEDHLIAAPITDEAGKVPSHLEIGEALKILMNKGILEMPVAKPDVDVSSEHLKVPRGHPPTQPTESNNLLMFQDNGRKSQTKSKYAHRSRSEPLVRITVDKSVNTSLHDVPALAIEDSLVQLKFQRQVNDNSCTQYFAIKSSLQLEPYLQDMRHRAAERERVLAAVAPKSKLFGPDVVDDGVVIKQRGKMMLSRASVASDVGENAKLEASSEEQLAVVNPNEEVVTVASQTVVLPGKAPPEPPSKTCRTCRMADSSATHSAELRSSQRVDGAESSVHKDLTRSSTLGNLWNDLSFVSGDGDSMMRMIFYEIRPSLQLINLSTSSYNIAEESKSFMLTWNFLKYADSLFFSLADVGKGDVKLLKEARAYKFNMTPGVHLFLLRCPMAVELYNVSSNKEQMIGKCELKLGRCLPNISHIYETTVGLQNKDLCLFYENLRPMHFGTLVVRFHMRGSQEQCDKCRPPKTPVVDIPPLVEADEPPPAQSRDVLSVGSRYSVTGGGAGRRSSAEGYNRRNIVSEAELQAFRDGLNLVLVRNKALRTTQEEITQELKDRTNWMHEELKWKLTLQENAILSGKDPGTIKWRQWKDDTTANVRYRPISHEEFLKDGVAHVEIEILELLLNPDSKPMLNDNLTHLYIELAFLDMAGKHMETLTVHKPTEDKPTVQFHFKREFDIAIDSQQAILLAETIRSNQSIPFTVIAQPVEYRTELQCCYDFGVANLVLFDLLQSRQNTTVETIAVQDSYYNDVVIGQLKIKFVGVLAMRSMALHILTPQTFKIIR